jgi:A/G-specific adenine glycosylase
VLPQSSVNAAQSRLSPERQLRFCPTFRFNARVRAAARLASQLVAWFRDNKRDLPWRRTRDPYAIWISEIMLQQTQVKTVIPYWERWMRELPTIESLANATEQRILKLWVGLGYYSRVRNAQRAAREIVTRYGGIFPKKFEDFLELPGIGRYTAGAIASIAFDLATPIVDGNVARVLTRYLGLRGDPKSKDTSTLIWTAAEKLVNAAREFDACGGLNEALMELGATVCLPREPACDRCPIQQKCFARKNGKTAMLPEMMPRAASETKLFRAALICRGDKVLLRQRSPDAVNGGFWELPNIEVETKRETPARSFERLFGARTIPSEHLCDVKHTIMRFRITLEIFAVNASQSRNSKFFKTSDLNSIPLVNAHRRALAKLGYLKDLQREQQKT